MKKLFTMFLVPALLLASGAIAQEPAAASPLPTQSPPAMDAAASPSNPQSTTSMQNMDKMATSVTQMADMCKMMMNKEMKGAPFKMAAGIGIGALLLIALVLFVILEVQWIIYWSRLLKAQKRDHRA